MALKLSSIKNLFIVDDDEKGTEKEQKKNIDSKETIKAPTEKTSPPDSKISWKSSTSHTTSETVDTNISSFSSSNNSSEGKYNQKIFDSLTKAIFDSDLPGEDYLEFMQALRSMKDLPLEENIKMKTALATLSTRGLTVQKVVESADYYMKILENEKKKFYTALDGQKKGNVESKRNAINDIEAQNKAKAEQIKKLTSEISANTIKAESLNKEISQVEGKIKSTENNFIFTYAKVANKITTDVEKIKTL